MKSHKSNCIFVLTFLISTLSLQTARAALFEPEMVGIARQYANEVLEKEGGPVKFQSMRKATISADEVKVQIDFLDAAGQPASREEIVYKNRKISSYTIRRLNVDEVGVIRFNGDQIEFEYTKKGKTKSEKEKESKLPTLINDMIVPFAIAHWDQLSKGEEIEFRLVVADRLETVGFKLMKDHETVVRGKRAMVVKMKPTSFIIAGIVKPLFFSFDSMAPHNMVEYQGRIVPKMVEKGSAHDFDGLTIVHDLPSAMAASEAKKKSP